VAIGLTGRRAVEVPLLQVIQRLDRAVAGLNLFPTASVSGEKRTRLSTVTNWLKNSPELGTEMLTVVLDLRPPLPSIQICRDNGVSRVCLGQRIKTYIFRKDSLSLGEVHVLAEKARVRDVRVGRHGGSGGEEQKRKKTNGAQNVSRLARTSGPCSRLRAAAIFQSTSTGTRSL
jgi:hypothetical protein